jgi:glycerol-3-phosphate dehydrogenase (NAD(P)+)
MKKKATIVGAGVMGSAMALPLCDRGYIVSIVGTPLDDVTITALQTNHLHPKLNVTLPKTVRAHFHHEYNSDDSDLIVLGVASAGVPWAIEKLRTVLKKQTPVLMITKGLSVQMEPLAHVVSGALHVPVAAIAGPCIAGELASRRPTGTVIVSHDFALALRLGEELQTEYYHPRPSIDVVGVEICAAFKNFFAIAVGWAHSATLNNNAAAILFDQAIREMMVLVKSFGGSAESVWGMPGAGDLYVTCQAGRNARLGQHLGRGLSYSAVKSGPMQHDTIEGAELGLAVADYILNSQRLDMSKLPLTLALLKTLTQDAPFDPPWSLFHV